MLPFCAVSDNALSEERGGGRRTVFVLCLWSVMAYRGFQDDESLDFEALRYTPPRSLRIIRIALRTIVVGAVFVLLWTGFWFVSAFRLRGDFEAWVAHQRHKGVEIDFRHFEIGGYPLSMRLDVTGPTVRDTRAAVPWSWSGEGVILQARPWTPGRLALFVSGKQRVTVGAAENRVTYSGGARRAEIHVRLGDGAWAGWPARAWLRISELRLLSPTPGRGLTLGDASFAYESVAAGNAAAKGIRLRAELSVHDLHVPALSVLPLGNGFRRLSARLAVRGRPAALTDEALARWRDAGGTAELSAIHIENGPLNVQGRGTFALDRKIQPIGAFTAKVEGLFPLLDQLRERGVLRDRDVVAAKLVLGALFQRPPGGGRPALSVALTLRDRKLFIGPVQIADVPEVTWPPAPSSGNAPSVPVPGTR